MIKAVYPFYIFYQSVIVVLGYYVVKTADNDAFKYAFLLVACFVMSVSLYHFYIRPYKGVRFLFGVKKVGVSRVVQPFPVPGDCIGGLSGGDY